ncbi:hypothetical protein T492DRAFT_1060636 [Pavlovales sp. CCMP2436]|nr:hypothetical protein T492DRAFT_1060636 [Pavlovales sp. CCMP2436]
MLKNYTEIPRLDGTYMACAHSSSPDVDPERLGLRTPAGPAQRPTPWSLYTPRPTPQAERATFTSSRARRGDSRERAVTRSA